MQHSSHSLHVVLFLFLTLADTQTLWDQQRNSHYGDGGSERLPSI